MAVSKIFRDAIREASPISVDIPVEVTAEIDVLRRVGTVDSLLSVGTIDALRTLGTVDALNSVGTINTLLSVGTVDTLSRIASTVDTNIAVDSVGLAKETTLSGIKTQTDKLQFDASNFLRIAVASSEIQVPVDIQNILPRKSELYGADETVAQSIQLDIGGFKTVEILARASAPTTFRVEFSFDGATWFTYYSSPTSETFYNDVIVTSAGYIRLSSDAAGAAGDTVDLIISAKP